MNYGQLISRHANHLTYGFLHYFFTLPGQSILISLFIPHFNRQLHMTNEGFGVLYAVATLVSAFCIPLVGGLVDRYKVRYVSLVNAILLVSFTFVISFAMHWTILFIGILGLRFTGQGMMGLIGSTAISRFFEADRGKALALSGLGLSVGEALMPVLVVSAIGGFDWAIAWRLLGLSVLVVFVPLTFLLIRKTDPFQLPLDEQDTVSSDSPDSFSRKQLLRERRFYAVLFPALFPAFVLTGLFIHQNVLAAHRNWSMEWMASCFIGFGVIKIATYFLAGPLVDRYTAKRVFPFFLLPLAVGLLLVTFFSHPLAALFYLLLAGVSNAMSAVLGSAVWAELYGVRYLGAIKSTLATFFVAATSVGSVLFGLLLSTARSMEIALIVVVLVMLLASVMAHRALR